jgi:hypothetical protein
MRLKALRPSADLGGEGGICGQDVEQGGVPDVTSAAGLGTFDCIRQICRE